MKIKILLLFTVLIAYFTLIPSFASAASNTFHEVSSESEIEDTLFQAIVNREESLKIRYNGSADNIMNIVRTARDNAVKRDSYEESAISVISGFNVSNFADHADISFDNFQYYTTRAQEEYVNQEVERIISEIINNQMNDDQKVKVIHDYITTHIQYDETLAMYTAYSALHDGKTVCNGYVQLAYKLLNYAGIETQIVKGLLNVNGQTKDHTWNLVKINNLWYHLDVTLNDTAPGSANGNIAYGYYNLSDAEIKLTHQFISSDYPQANKKYSYSGGTSRGSSGSGIPTTVTGVIIDAVTGKPIVGADVTLYYANTDRNKINGKTPDTVVPLPDIDGFKPINNINPQLNDASGAYGFMVFPTSDYYIVATKEGYEAYQSPTISVKQDLVKWDFKMNQTITGVKRLAGLTRVDTSLEIAKANYTSKLSSVVLATAENYPDALAGSVLAYKLNAPILLVGRTETDQEKILAYLKSNLETTGTVYILGGTAVVSAEMEAKVAAGGFNQITRLGGIDRYETAIKIADELGIKTGTPIVLVYGENYADALAISSSAAGMQSPILLVQKEGLSDAVQQEIAKIKPSKVYIIGGEGVISATVESQVAQITSLEKTNIVRIAGADRYATSLAVAQYFNLSGQSVCIATGNNFPDALAGSVYAANYNAPIILADGTLSDQVMNYLKDRTTTGATLFGGEAVVSQNIEQQIGRLIGK